MPAIFTHGQRDELARQMIDAGWDVLTRVGIRALRVEQIAAAAGIAKGTFYHFFSSKADFIYAMLMENRQRGVDELERRRADAGRPLTRDELREWFRLRWHGERNIFRLATADEYVYLVRSFPPERALDPAADAQLVRWIADEVVAAPGAVDVPAVENLQKVIAITLLNRSCLRPEALERTVDTIIEDILDAFYPAA